MTVVVVVRNDKRVLRQRAIGQVRPELAKGDQVLGLSAVVAHVGKIRERVVVLGVTARVTARISHGGQILRIFLPGFPGLDELANDIVVRNSVGKTIVVCDDLPGGQHEVITDRGMCVRIVALRESVSRRQAVQIRHVGIAKDARIAVVFFHHDKNVPNLPVGRRARRRCGSLTDWSGTAATGLNKTQGYDYPNESRCRFTSCHKHPPFRSYLLHSRHNARVPILRILVRRQPQLLIEAHAVVAPQRDGSETALAVSTVSDPNVARTESNLLRIG